MTTKTDTIANVSLKPNVPEIRPGDTVRVHQKVKEAGPSTGSTGSRQTGSGQAKERIQVFEGVVLAAKHGKGVQGTITVRRVARGVGVERIFPLHSPLIEKIEVTKRSKVRRAKLYYLREAKGRKARLKAKAFNLETPEEESQQEVESRSAEGDSTSAQIDEEQKSNFSQNTTEKPEQKKE